MASSRTAAVLPSLPSVTESVAAIQSPLRHRHALVFHALVMITFSVHTGVWLGLGWRAPALVCATTVVVLGVNLARATLTRLTAGLGLVGLGIVSVSVWLQSMVLWQDTPLIAAWCVFGPIFAWILGSPRVSALWTLLIVALTLTAGALLTHDDRGRHLPEHTTLFIGTFQVVSMAVMSFVAMRMLSRNHQTYVHELTAHRRSVEAMNAQLRQTQRYKDSFYSTVSHELRTPMNAITGIAELLQLDPAAEADQPPLLDALRESSRHLLGIINDLLDLNKLSSQQLRLVVGQFDLHDAVRSAVTMARSARAAPAGVVVKLELAPATPRYVVGDRLRLVQVLVNLVVNALKFTPAGAITIRAAPAVGLGTADRPCGVRVDVIDTGIGIPAPVQASLFQEFVQADGEIAVRFGGTGLGLSISRRLVEMMGGRLTFVSVEGQGSTFTVEVALAEGRAPTAPPVDATADATAGHRLLVVDDNRLNLMVAKRLLDRLVPGAEIDTACDGVEAVALVGAHRYDMIFMDMQMPNMDGEAATRKIRAMTDSRARIPIVAMTANTDTGDLQACLDAGMNQALSKPVSSTTLRQVLRQYIPAGGSSSSNWDVPTPSGLEPSL
ncbi:MAG: response regulator [Kofleriaceae bacterium]